MLYDTHPVFLNSSTVWSVNDINKCKGLSKILGNHFIHAFLFTNTRTVNDGDPSLRFKKKLITRLWKRTLFSRRCTETQAKFRASNIGHHTTLHECNILNFWGKLYKRFIPIVKIASDSQSNRLIVERYNVWSENFCA